LIAGGASCLIAGGAPCLIAGGASCLIATFAKENDSPDLILFGSVGLQKDLFSSFQKKI
jgi:hypothetical protein